MKSFKICSFLLCIVMVVGLAMPAAAAKRIPETREIVEIVESPLGIYESNAAVDPERTTPKDEIIIPIMPDKGFKDADGNYIVWATDDLGTFAHQDWTNMIYNLGPSVHDLKNNGVKPYLMHAAESNVIRDYEWVKYKPTRSVPAQAALRIRFIEDFVSTSEVTYRFTVYLNHKGKLFDTQETFGGMISNNVIEVYKNDYVNLEHGEVARSYITADEVKVGLGNGVNLYSDMVYDERYYGIAKLYGKGEGNVITDAYPEIEDIYELKTVNLRTHGDLVEFTRYNGDPHYVYNIAGEYLGMTTDRLPYSRIYYLSKKAIEIDVNVEKLARQLEPDTPNVPYPGKELERFASGLSDNIMDVPDDAEGLE